VLIVCTTAPMLKMDDARMRDQRRPYFAVKGQTKKQEKKPTRENEHEIVDVIRSRVEAYRRLGVDLSNWNQLRRVVCPSNENLFGNWGKSICHRQFQCRMQIRRSQRSTELLGRQPGRSPELWTSRRTLWGVQIRLQVDTVLEMARCSSDLRVMEILSQGRVLLIGQDAIGAIGVPGELEK
jgi:hypothetical protein